MELFWWILGYVFIVTAFQIAMIIRGAIKYKIQDDVVDPNFSPSVSILIPAYNEEKTIISSVKGALRQDYDDFDVIVIDDGSADNTLNLLTEFKEKNDYSNLRIIHKENGGKFSALNTGMEESDKDWILAVDADSLIIPSTISTLVKRKRPDATGMTCSIGFINNCEVDDGIIKRKKMPTNLLVVSQMLEYIRTFIMLKMSLDSVNGTMIMSGACSFFDKEYVQSIGGYRDRITEDSELTLRMLSDGRNIQFVCDVLSYTEAPESIPVLHRQRMRWVRGLLRDMWEYKGKMEKNNAVRKFMVPYFYIADVVFPWIELIGWAWFFVSLFVIGNISLWFSLMFMGALYSLFLLNNVVLLTVGSKKMKMSFDYESKWLLFVTAAFDLFYYRPIMIFFVVKAQMKELFNTSYKWGDMKRKGF